MPTGMFPAGMTPVDDREVPIVQMSRAKYSWWSREQRPFSKTEIVADAVVHGLGLVIAIFAGAFLLTYAILWTAPKRYRH